MKLRRPPSAWALWGFVAALLLNGAMPLLASLAAQAQGKALVEVCTLYGVARIAPAGADAAPATDHPADPAAAHCALAGLTAPPPLAAASALAAAVALRCRIGAVPARPTLAPRDPCASWAARLRHGPPTLA